MEVSPNLFAGISVNITSGNYTYDCLYTENDTKGNYTVFPADIDEFSYEQTYRDDLSGVNALFGLFYKKENKFALGITLRTPTKYEISEDYSQTYGSKFDPIGGITYSYSVLSSSSFSYRVTTPMVISGGVSVYPLSWLMVAADAEYTDWTQVEMESDDASVDAGLQTENRWAKNNFRATTNLRGGAEVTLFDLGVKLRGGISWKPSPYKADENTHDYDTYYYTAGAGIQIDRNTWVNISYALGYGKRTNDWFGSTTGIYTNENLTTNFVNVSLSYKF
jgi:long-subunit fatty acid transport protein